MFTSTLFAVLVGVCYGQLPHGHQLTDLIDQGFDMFDSNHNGVLEYTEMQALTQLEDANHDGMVSLDEYMAFFKMPIEVAQPLFNVYDKDNDGLLSVDFLMDYIHILDTNGNGEIDLKEYEHYNTGFLHCVFDAHGTHGHGHDCSTWHGH